MAGLRGNRPSQVQSPPCIDQRSPVPCEPYRPVNRDGSGNGWRVGEGSLPAADQGPGGPMDQEGRLGWGLVQLVQLEHPGEHCRKGHFLDSPAAKDSVKNICGEDKLVHTGNGICTGPGTP